MKCSIYKCYVICYDAKVHPNINHSVCTSKKTQHFSVTKISFLMLLKEIIAVCTENYTSPIKTKFRVTDY
jgi:hypothetical protein